MNLRTSGSSVAGGSSERLFVGRERELSELRSGLEDAISGRGRVMLVTGEPGIGKTRLVDELETHAAGRGARVLWGRCWEGGGAPAFWPWVHVIRSYARGQDPEELGRELGLGGAYIAQILPELRERVPGLAETPAPSSLESEHARFYLFDAVATFLRVASDKQPLVLVFDDLHDADRSSLLLLEFVARELRGMRILLLGTYREREAARSPDVGPLLTRLGREGRRVAVTGLDPREVEALIQEDIRDFTHVGSVVAAVHRVTEGNPFFIDEVIRLLVSEGRWKSRGALDWSELGIPEGIRQTIHRRLLPLPDGCRELLAIAAVAGREFTAAVLGAVSGRPTDTVLEALDAAQDAGVVQQASPGLGRYRFAHALVRETLYDDLQAVPRLRLHREVGEALERIYGKDVEAHVAELAHHFFHTATIGGWEKALDYAVRTGRAAAAQLAFEEAARHYERARGVLEAQPSVDESQRSDLLLALADAQWRTDDHPKAQETYRRAADSARAAGDSERAARAALGIGASSLGITSFEAMASVRGGEEAEVIVRRLEEGLRVMPEADSATRARLLARLAAALYSHGTPERREALTSEAEAMARRIGDPSTQALVLACKRFAWWDPNDVAGQLTTTLEMLRFSEESGDRDQVLTARLWLLMDQLELGNVAAADLELERIERLAQEVQQPLYLAYATMVRGMRAFMAGRLEEAERFAQEALLVGQQAGNELATMFFEAQMFRTFSEQGRLGELEAGLRYLLDQGAALPAVRCTASFLYSEIGKMDEARAEFERFAFDGFASVPRNVTWLLSTICLAHACARLGDAPRARILRGLLEPFRGRNVMIGPPPVAWWGPVSYYLGLLAQTMGDADLAARDFDDALEMSRKVVSRPFAAHTQHACAALLLRTGERTRALALLDEALSTAAELGMKNLLERAEALRAEAETEASGAPSPSVTTAAATASPIPGDTSNVFQKEGDVWRVSFDGRAFRLRDARGLRYVACLLREPGRDFHVTDLVAEVTPGEALATREALVELEAGSGLGDAGEVLDLQAKADYRRRLEDLRDELAEAERIHDPGRAARARDEIDFLTSELSGAYGLGGRSRKAADSVERARKAVTNRIRDAISRIRKESPDLALHLTNSVRMGTFCSYRPEKPTRWEL